MDLIFAVVVMVLVAGVVLTKRMHLDLFKDRMFRLREEWFDLALDERSSLEFDSRLYRSVEGTLCSMLRTADLYTALSVVSIMVRIRLERNRGQEATKPALQDELNQIEDAYTMRKALEIWRRLTFSLHNYLCARSMGYLIWAILMIIRQPAKEPAQAFLYEGVSESGPFLRQAAG